LCLSEDPRIRSRACRELSAAYVTIGFMGVTAEQIAKVPAANIRVSREAFGRLWAYADEVATRPGVVDDHYAVGVLWTCEWLSRQPVWSSVLKRMRLQEAPVTERHHAAMPETIEAEYFAAVRRARPGETGQWAELARGVLATLEWAWHGSGKPPLEVPDPATN
jgi:hypothetical protein